MLDKREELSNEIFNKNPDVVQITELLPKHGKIDDIQTEFKIPGYSLFSNHNPLRGIAVYIKDIYDPKQVCDEINIIGFNECVWCTLTVDSLTLLLGCVYRNTTFEKNSSTESLIQILNKANNLSCDKLIVTGDFNYPGINWETSTSSDQSEEINNVQDMYLTQFITDPTGRRLTKSAIFLIWY